MGLIDSECFFVAVPECRTDPDHPVGIRVYFVCAFADLDCDVIGSGSDQESEGRYGRRGGCAGRPERHCRKDISVDRIRSAVGTFRGSVRCTPPVCVSTPRTDKTIPKNLLPYYPHDCCRRKDFVLTKTVILSRYKHISSAAQTDPPRYAKIFNRVKFFLDFRFRQNFLTAQNSGLFFRHLLKFLLTPLYVRVM